MYMYHVYVEIYVYVQSLLKISSKARGNDLKYFQDFILDAKALNVLCLPYSLKSGCLKFLTQKSETRNLHHAHDPSWSAYLNPEFYHQTLKPRP